MSFPFPPGINIPPITLPPPSPVYWLPPPPLRTNNSAIAAIVIAFSIAFMVIIVACKLCTKKCEEADANGTGSATVVLAAWPRSPPSSVPVQPEPWYYDYGEHQVRTTRSDGDQAQRPRSDGDEGRRPRRVSPAAELPSFPYNRSVRHNITDGGGEEAASCSVCLGAFQTGETVRLLPVCLHLFHVECIDPWLDMHSTCPICRSSTDPTTDSLHPPV
ncbi:unnamed protein product [Urochloa humidicola]